MICLKLLNLNSLEQEFFERKRQLKGNTRTAPSPKRIDKATGKGSQDLFSLEVIMAAHKKDIKQRKEITQRDSTTTESGDWEIKENSGKLRLQDVPTKQLQHILPELSPVRQKLPAANLDESKCGNFCLDHDKRECIFTSMPPGGQMDDHESMPNRQGHTVPIAMNDKDIKLGAWEATFELGTAMYPTK
ncbi:hypothetical protein ACROYT_G033927 [Oculina patagonica]